MISGTVGEFPSVILFFAWAASNRIPLVLWQQGFLGQFDVCFHLARSHVEVQPAVRPGP